MNSFSNTRTAWLHEGVLLALLSVPLPGGAGDLPAFNVPGSQVRCYTCSGHFTDLRKASDGTRVYAASDGGVLEFAPDGTFRSKVTRKDGLCGHGVRELLPVPDGRLWVATTAGAGERAAGRWTSYTRRQGLNDDCVYALAADPGGRLYAGTEKGINRLHGVRFESFDDTHEFGRKPTYGIHSARDGSLWFAKANCLTHYTAAGRWETFQRDPFQDDRQSRFLGERFLCVVTDGRARPWIGTDTGVGYLDGPVWKAFLGVERFFGGRGLLDNRIVTLACDTQGYVWAGYGDTRDFDRALGLTRFRGDDWQHLSTKDGLPSDAVYRVRSDETGGVWVATGEGGCYLNADRRVYYRPVSELADNHVVALRTASGGGMVVRTVKGTAWFLHGDRQESAPPLSTAAVPVSTAMVADPALRIPGIRDLGPRVVLQGADGRVWLGTRDEGLFCREGDQWRRVLLNGQAFPREITSLCEEAPGVLWVGTAAEGAIRMASSRDASGGNP